MRIWRVNTQTPIQMMALQVMMEGAQDLLGAPIPKADTKRAAREDFSTMTRVMAGSREWVNEAVARIRATIS
jgi:hypothetical protein